MEKQYIYTTALKAKTKATRLEHSETPEQAETKAAEHAASNPRMKGEYRVERAELKGNMIMWTFNLSGADNWPTRKYAKKGATIERIV